MLHACMLKVHVSYVRQPRTYHLTPRRRALGKAVARGSKKAIIDECFRNRDLRKLLIEKIGRVSRAELATMCSEGVNSVLCQTSHDVYKAIDFDRV